MAAGLKKKLTRAEKADENRKALFEAAATVVGQHGYANASVGRIAEQAKLAQGTFYLYFESRQDLFDQLLPMIGEEMLAYISQCVKGSKDFFELEERGMIAFFNFLTRRQGFFRILREVDPFSDIAAEKHYSLLTRRYAEVMKRALDEAQIRPLDPLQSEVLTYVMIGARDYIYRYAIKGKSESAAKIEEVVKAYICLLRNGVGKA